MDEDVKVDEKIKVDENVKIDDKIKIDENVKIDEPVNFYKNLHLPHHLPMVDFSTSGLLDQTFFFYVRASPNPYAFHGCASTGWLWSSYTYAGSQEFKGRYQGWGLPHRGSEVW